MSWLDQGTLCNSTSLAWLSTHTNSSAAAVVVFTVSRLECRISLLTGCSLSDEYDVDEYEVRVRTDSCSMACRMSSRPQAPYMKKSFFKTISLKTG